MLNEIVAELFEKYFLIVAAIVTSYMIIYIARGQDSRPVRQIFFSKVKKNSD